MTVAYYLILMLTPFCAKVTGPLSHMCIAERPHWRSLLVPYFDWVFRNCICIFNN